MKSKMIVSSKVLRNALLVGIPMDPNEDHVVTFRCDDISVEVSGQPVTNVMRDWEDFDIDRDKAKKLHAILMAMSEQPITVMYDGNWFTIQEVFV